YPMRLATQAAFEGHPYGTPASGTEDSLKRIGGDDIRRWHAERALNASAVIGLVGDVDPDELASLAARAFADLRHTTRPAIAAPSWPTTITTSVETRDRAQTA